MPIAIVKVLPGTEIHTDARWRFIRKVLPQPQNETRKGRRTLLGR